MFQKTVLGALVVAAAAAAVLVVKELRDRRQDDDEDDQDEDEEENAGVNDDDDEIHFVEIRDDSEENKGSAHLDGVKMDDNDEEEDEDDDVEIHKFDSADHHEEDVKEEPEKEEESEEKKAAAPQVNEEEGPHEIPISDGEDAEETSAADDKGEEAESPSEDEDYSDEVKEVADLYPYLKPAFIKEILGRNDAYNAQFPEDTLVCAVHHVKFADLHSLLRFEGILNDAGYTCTHQEDGSVQASKRFFVEDGAIISDILNVANQASALGGSYQDCDLIQ
ncbi:MAG: hypothetical protein SOI44_05175 [Lactimicrobium sp.]|jgi:hypothetical protein|uniref:hypothetical protein n=1 Tax=Lactimicrobium sp. TaxID=2563780 RepID=UPI002F358CB8